MYQTKVRESQLPWVDLGMPGVMMKVLHKDEGTGAMAVLTRMEPSGPATKSCNKFTGRVPRTTYASGRWSKSS